MKNFLKYAVSCLALGALLAGCSDWVESERVITQHPDEQSPILRDNAYYAALRDWKRNTKHKIAFGWYGSWTAVGASYQTRLASAPDSMDIISIWSQWHSLTPEQMADKEFVQKIKGTKVTFTIFAHEVPDEFLVDGEVTPEGLATYARAYARDSMNKYSYDGIDLDYEPGFGGTGPLVGHDNENMKIFCQELSKYVGPKSGTGRLFMIDGVPYAVHKEIAELFDYGIVQAYNSSGYTDLQNRFDNAYAKGWKPEQYIFAENFESFWKNGGVTHTCRDGQVVNSLLGMARFNPEQGYCGGFGAYHMEYEYGNSAMPYKYMREAIQDVNPAGGSIVASFTKNDMPEYSFLIESDGSISGSMDEKVQLTLSQKAPADLTVSLAMDNSLVETYNLKNGKSYLTVDPERVSLGTLEIKAGEFLSGEAPVGFDAAGAAKGEYLLPIVAELPEGGAYVSKSDPMVRYIVIRVSTMDIDTEATALTGTKIEPAAGWTISCYQGTNSSGATGVWNCDTDEQKSKMFDGKLDEQCWYASSQSFSWGYGGNFIIGLDKTYNVSGFRWHYYYEDSNPQITDVRYSEDGKNWTSLSNQVAFVPKVTDQWKIFQFKEAVKARYIRVYVGNVSGFTSMNEAEIHTPAN